jgi:predicted  nucleic acid-binding Zn-ribbon protein
LCLLNVLNQLKSNLESECSELQNRLETVEHQLETEKNRHNEIENNARQMASNLEAAESSAVDYSEALRAKVKCIFLSLADFLFI